MVKNIIFSFFLKVCNYFKNLKMRKNGFYLYGETKFGKVYGTLKKDNN